ncbi:Cytochrome b reductase 1 [Acipenser ruthenus]|uniref:Plasma membrane ascorbate-dependent reductase CYBRD1 n=1 Tax=Acipenser ruthenus TaxID=7906 RepID=A0A662YS40_ACIRT|nr:Cytochrome b reductase 1 [Acipenser ruthenus]
MPPAFRGSTSTDSQTCPRSSSTSTDSQTCPRSSSTSTDSQTCPRSSSTSSSSSPSTLLSTTESDIQTHAKDHVAKSPAVQASNAEHCPRPRNVQRKNAGTLQQQAFKKYGGGIQTLSCKDQEVAENDVKHQQKGNNKTRRLPSEQREQEMSSLPGHSSESSCSLGQFDVSSTDRKQHLKLDDWVLLERKLKGVVRYIGFLATTNTKEIFVGVELDRPCGESDGEMYGKRYFTCKPNHGTFTPISDIQKLVLGLCIFLFPMTPAFIRAAFMPIHVYSGLLIFGTVIATALMGITEKLFFALKNPAYKDSPPEAVFINTLGLLIVVFGGTVLWMVTRPSWKRPGEEASTFKQDGRVSSVTENELNLNSFDKATMESSSEPWKRKLKLEETGLRSTM